MLLTLVRRSTRFRLDDGVVDLSPRQPRLLRDGSDRLLAVQAGFFPYDDLPRKLRAGQLDRRLGRPLDDDGDLAAHTGTRPVGQLRQAATADLLVRLRQLTAHDR